MSVAQRVSEAEYAQIVLAEPDELWELHDGQLVEKPPMTWEHDHIAFTLGHRLASQLDRRQFRIRINGRVRRPGSIYLPDVFVVPTEYGDEFRSRPGVLAVFSRPLPLVVEVWSRSTGNYDVDAKLPLYQERGDLEIWRIHPYERTLTAWVRQPEGSCAQTVYRDGPIRPTALPGVEITLDNVFDV